MAFARLPCVNHPDRPAQGLCVVTGKPVCAECSTRRDGVNYSHEGLALLRERREAGRATARRRQRLANFVGVLLFPPGLALLAVLFRAGAWIGLRILFGKDLF